VAEARRVDEHNTRSAGALVAAFAEHVRSFAAAPQA
jgi:hypothetical protein